MITIKDISELNVIAFIRQQKLKGLKTIYWNKKNIRYFRKIAKIMYNSNGFRFPHNFPNGDMFMGIKHYKK